MVEKKYSSQCQSINRCPVMSLLELFCHVDDFWQRFRPCWEQEMLQSGLRPRRRSARLPVSEVMTIMIRFHQSRYRNFKAYYTQQVLEHLRPEFPGLVSYERFVSLMPGALVPLCAYLASCYGSGAGVSFIDSTPIAVCHNRRIASHRVFAGMVRMGKTSVGWFFGFKLHLVVNDRGELLACQLTAGNVDDRKPVPRLSQGLLGRLQGDRGYISQKLSMQLFARGLRLVTKLKRNMKPIALSSQDSFLLRQRAIIESINDQLKNISQIEHTRHRSPTNFLVNLVSGLIAYCHQPKKPSLSREKLPALPNPAYP